MQLVEDEELQATRCLHQLTLVRPGQDQFEHHVVGEQDVWRVRDDLPLFDVALLARVALERDGAAAVWIPVVQELHEFLLLAVGQSVHRVDDDRLDAASALAAQHAVDDRDNVGDALS